MFFLKLLIFIAFFFNADYVAANDKNDNHEIKIEVIGKSKVNIRTGPGTQYDVVGQVNPNEWMWAYGGPNIDKEWIKATKMGLTGYVNTRYVRVVRQITYQFNQGIAKRYNYVAVIAATSCLLLLETECPCGIIHIAVCKSADIRIILGFCFVRLSNFAIMHYLVLRKGNQAKSEPKIALNIY